MNSLPSEGSSSHRPARRLGRSLSRTTRLVLAGGVAAGAGFASITGIAAAATGPSTVLTSQTRSSAPAPTPPLPTGGGGAMGAGPMGGPGPLGGPGGRGTITAISGSTLTLRTFNGTETVDTSSSTIYTKEMASITFADLQVGDVVAVAGPPPVSPSSSGSAKVTPAPTSGTVDASRITVVEPTFVGRVTTDRGGLLTLVGRDGQLLTVDTTGSTAYYRGRQKVTSSVVIDGTVVVAEGTRTGVTSLDAVVVSVVPAPPAPGRAPAPHDPPVPPASSKSAS
ncbi:MAG: DUF5666 domain-containing protein [Acidimicrobiales bacterium]